MICSVRINSEDQAVSVTLIDTYIKNDAVLTRPRGVAEASELPSQGPGYWYTNRVLVTRPEDRGSGTGSYLLTLLKATLQQHKGFVALLVEPGGYGVSPKKQINFYRKNGFVRAPKVGPNVYIWKPGLVDNSRTELVRSAKA